jgi:hypothetical protein
VTNPAIVRVTEHHGEDLVDRFGRYGRGYDVRAATSIDALCAAVEQIRGRTRRGGVSAAYGVTSLVRQVVPSAPASDTDLYPSLW